MLPRRKPTLLAQGEPRTLGGGARRWRVRLNAPEDGGTKYQVMLRALAGAGDPWKRVLRRASTEEEARKIFALAEAALDTEQATPVGADVRASRTIRMLGEEYLRDCWAAYILLTQRLGDSADGISGLAISTARGRCADARPTPTLTIGFLALHQTPNLLAVAGIALVVAGVNRSRRQMVAGRAQPSPG